MDDSHDTKIQTNKIFEFETLHLHESHDIARVQISKQIQNNTNSN